MMGQTPIFFHISYFTARQLRSATSWDHCGSALKKENITVKRDCIILDRVPHSNMLLHLFELDLSLLWPFLRLFPCPLNRNCLSAIFLERSQKFARSACKASECCWVKHSCFSYMGLWRDWDKDKPTEGSKFFKRKNSPADKILKNNGPKKQNDHWHNQMQLQQNE